MNVFPRCFAAALSLLTLGTCCEYSRAAPPKKVVAKAATKPVAPNADVLNARDFGARPNDKKDDTVALQKLFDAAGKSGARVLIPAGVYDYSALTVNNPVIIEGNGPRTTILRKSTSGGDGVLVKSAQVHIRDLGFDASPRQRGGAFVHFQPQCYECSLEEFTMSGAFVGVWNSGAHRMNIEKGSMRDAATGAGSAGIVVSGGNDHYVRQVTMDNAPNAMPEAGIRADNTGCVNITDCDIIHCGKDLWMRGEGGGAFSFFVANTYFDTADYGVYIDSIHAVERCKFVNVWMCSHNFNGLYIEDSKGSVDNIEFDNCYFMINGGAGVVIKSGTNVAIMDSTLALNGTKTPSAGIEIGASAREVRVTGNKIGATKSLGGQEVGVSFDGGDGGHLVTGNNLRGNSEAPIRGDAGASSLVKDNLL